MAEEAKENLTEQDLNQATGAGIVEDVVRFAADIQRLIDERKRNGCDGDGIEIH